MEWNDGMEQWNETLEWNGMTTPIHPALTTYTHCAAVVSEVLIKEDCMKKDGFNLIQQGD